MKLKNGIMTITVVFLAVSFGAIAVVPTETPDTEAVGSAQDLVEILEMEQVSIQAVSLPSSDVYVSVKKIPLPVDWSGFDKKVTKYMTAAMGEYGLPRYALLLWEDPITRDRVIALASTGYEVVRIPAPKDYQPEAFYTDLLSRGGTYSEAMSWIFDPAHTATEVILIPEILYPAYEQYEAEKVAQEELLAAQEAVAASPEEDKTVSVSMALVPADAMAVSSEAGEEVAMAMASIPPPPGGGDTNGVPEGGASTSNLLVELAISLSEDFGYMDHIEIFFRDNLIYSTNWALATDGEWVPTLGRQTVYWVDQTSSNKACSFFFISDGSDTDGDGHSDMYEEWADTNPDVFDEEDFDSDGINDWWETKLFGDLSQDLMDDTDGDGLTNHMEIVVDSMGRIIAMISDPNLEDSDAEGLDDFQERRVWNTDPMDPDSDDDGRDDASEVLGSPPSDPHNPDTVAPIVAFFGS